MQKSKIPESEFHQSIRGYFAGSLYNEMIDNPNIITITADLGFGMFDRIRDDFPDRFYNVGAAEQCAVGMAIGLALSGKIPFVYSISSFLIFRPFEFIRNYINHERIPVRLVGSGLNDDYKHDGITHHTWDLDECVANQFPNIETYYPTEKESLPDIVRDMIEFDEPSFLCLRR